MSVEITGWLVLGLIVLVGLLLFRTKGGRLLEHAQQENEQLKIQLEVLRSRLSTAEEEARKVKEQLVIKGDHLQDALLSAERERAVFAAQQERLAQQRDEIGNLHQKLNKDFELLANRILEEKTQRFSEYNRNNMDALLHPLKENIKAFEDKVDKVYRTEAAERNILQGELRKLMELNQQISNEANNLTKALKADNKKQGNWGEVVLDRILEASGLLLNESYTKQTSYTGENGERLQPDVVINLPEDKHLIIDAKVSLVAYNNLVNAEQEEDRVFYLKQHIQSLRGHVKNLSQKNYSDLYHIQSPDFVLLFIPIESCFSVAVQHDLALFEYAWNKRVVMVSPSTLLATLKTIASVWKHERQTKNAVEIATRAGQMYDKFVAFVADLNKVGDLLDRSKGAYTDALNKLSSGSGNLIGRAERLKEMGAKASKQLNIKMLPEVETEE